MSTFRRTVGFILVCCLLLGVGLALAEHGHTYTWEELQKPTCTETGIRRGVCSCGDQKYEYPAALGHDWTNWDTVNATCTKAGSRTRTCRRDNSHVENDILPQLDHVMTQWSLSKSPTCTDVGEETRRCSTCDTKPEKRDIPAIGHNWSEWRTDKNATCFEKGSQSKGCLNGCGIARETRDIAVLNHNWGQYEVVKPANCTEEGLSRRNCQYACGVKPEEKVLPALGHNLGPKQVVKNATCVLKGEIHEVCTRGDYTKKTEIPALGKNQPNGHKFSAWSKTLDPTCSKVGKEKRTCSDCTREETRDIAKLPHTSNKVWETVREATLSKLGLQVTHCTVCGQQASSRNVAPKGYRYEVPTYAYGPLAGEYPGGGSGSTMRLIYLNLTENSDQRYALVTEDGWLIGYARVTVAGGTVKVSLEKASDPTVMRYRAWGMFPDPATARAVNYDNSLPFDQAVKGPGDSCVIAVNMISNYYQGRENQQFSDALMSPSGASYGELNQAMLQMAEGSEE